MQYESLKYNGLRVVIEGNATKIYIGDWERFIFNGESFGLLKRHKRIVGGQELKSTWCPSSRGVADASFEFTVKMGTRERILNGAVRCVGCEYFIA